MDRPRQQVPGDLVNRLMLLVRTQFCGDMSGAEWGKHSHFVRRNVIMWPARFICDKHNFSLSGERYESIMRGVFMDIKRNMTGAPVRYWPGYLMHCVQEHWVHHWEEYYQEAKAAANLTQAGLLALQRLPAGSDNAIETIAAAQRILAHKAKRKGLAAPKQLGLL